ncbi:MAG TPA: serine hydrolase domain-containing protein [Candidatus Eremiobacteraceae bacterium]|jgi:CubicO group peptidase (beta-lactamase class C family)
MAAVIFVFSPTAAPSPSASGQDPAATVDRYLTDLVPFGFSGNVIVAQRGVVLLEKGYGLADRENKIPVTPETVMTVGSISKQFTAAAVLKLEMEGKLHTTDPISDYLPDVPADKRSITIHELLTHTAGFASDYGDGDYEPIGRDAFVARVLAAPLLSKPGSQFLYSNAGYGLAAAIVERVSGTSYERFLHDNLFAPAGMVETGFDIPHWKVGQVAVGYNDDGRWGTMPEHWRPDGPYWNQIGSGGIQSTPRDMYRWHEALSGEAILSAAEIRKFQTGYVASGPDSRYAYGWGIKQTPVGLLISHNGGNGTFFADFLRFMDTDTVVYIASNEATIPATQLSRNVAYIAFGQPVDIPPSVSTLSRSSLQGRSGTYQTSDGRKLMVAADDGTIVLSTADPLLFDALSKNVPADVTADATSAAQAFIKHGGPVDRADHPNWQRLIAVNGPFRSATLLGVTTEQGDPVSWIAVQFQRTSRFVELRWGSQGLSGVEASDGPPGFRYYPESAERFFSYDVDTGIVQRVSFDKSGRLEIGSTELSPLELP